MIERESLKRLTESVSDLFWALDLYQSVADRGIDQEDAYWKVVRRVGALTDLLATVYGSDLALLIRTLRQECIALRVEGFKPAIDGSPARWPTVTKGRRDNVQAVQMMAIERYEGLKARDEVERAQREGVFIEYVQRNPGKGYIRTFPPFEEDVEYDLFEGGKQSWTDCDVFVYPNNRWVVARTFQHIEAPNVSDYAEYKEIPASEAAARVLWGGVELGVDDLIWLKSLADSSNEPDSTPAPKIFWNCELGELMIDGRLARRVARVNQAKRVVTVLNAFQEDGWPERIDSPFPSNEPGKQTLREAVRSLNNGAKGIRFEADGTGEGIRFRLVCEAKSHEQPQVTDFAIPF